MYKLSKYITWAEKNDIIVVYINYNYYFFRNDTKNWIKNILNSHIGIIDKQISSSFVEYLLNKSIIENE